MSDGPRSRIQVAPASSADSSDSTQSTGSTIERIVSVRARAASKPQASAQVATRSAASARSGWWNASWAGSGSRTGANGEPPVTLRSRSDFSAAATSSRRASTTRRLSAGPESTTPRRPLRRRETTRSDAGQLGQDRVDALGHDVGDAEHRGAEQATATADELRRSTHQAGEGEQLDVVDAGERLGREVALRVTDDGGGRHELGVDALTVQGAETGELGEQDAGYRGSGCIQHRGARQFGSVVVLGGLADGDDIGPLEGRERHADPGELGGDRSEALLGLRHEGLELGLEREVTDQTGKRLEPRGSLGHRTQWRTECRLRCDRPGRRGARSAGSWQAGCRLSSRGIPRGTAVAGSTGGPTIIAKHEGFLKFNARVSSCFLRDLAHMAAKLPGALAP